jgi:hypothetical protein
MQAIAMNSEAQRHAQAHKHSDIKKGSGKVKREVFPLLGQEYQP